MDVAPEPLAVWHKELEGLFCNFPDSLSKGSLTSLLKRGSDVAVFGFFLSCGPDAVCLEETFRVVCAFLEKKVHSLGVAPEPLSIWNKKLEGLESKLFDRTVYLSFCSPRA